MKKEKMKLLDLLKSIKRGTQILILVVVLVAIVTGLWSLKSVLFSKEEEELSTISKSSLEKVIKINELSTVDYTYNAIAKAYDEDGVTIKYYVAYEGTVTAGIDFQKINIDVDEEEKKVIITLPDIEIQDVRIDMGTMEYIFVKDRYETETVSQEAYKVSMSDLNDRISQENTLNEMAEENAISSVKALFTPWIEQIHEKYTVEIH